MRVCLHGSFILFQQIQEFRTGATRQNMETVHAKEESKKFRQQLTDLRSKVADLESRVCIIMFNLGLILISVTKQGREYLHQLHYCPSFSDQLI